MFGGSDYGAQSAQPSFRSAYFDYSTMAPAHSSSSGESASLLPSSPSRPRSTSTVSSDAPLESSLPSTFFSAHQPFPSDVISHAPLLRGRCRCLSRSPLCVAYLATAALATQAALALALLAWLSDAPVGAQSPEALPAAPAAAAPWWAHVLGRYSQVLYLCTPLIAALLALAVAVSAPKAPVTAAAAAAHGRNLPPPLAKTADNVVAAAADAVSVSPPVRAARDALRAQQQRDIAQTASSAAGVPATVSVSADASAVQKEKGDPLAAQHAALQLREQNNYNDNIDDYDGGSGGSRNATLNVNDEEEDSAPVQLVQSPSMRLSVSLSSSTKGTSRGKTEARPLPPPPAPPAPADPSATTSPSKGVLTPSSAPLRTSPYHPLYHQQAALTHTPGAAVTTPGGPVATAPRGADGGVTVGSRDDPFGT